MMIFLKKMNLISKLFYSKWTTRAIFFIILLVLIWLDFVHQDFFRNHSTLASALVTLIYVSLTYELLRATRDSRAFPHIDVRFIITHKLDADFSRKYPEINQTEEFRLISEATANNALPNQNIVFVRLENIGPAVALKTELNIEYSKKNLATESTSKKPILLETLKPSEIVMRLIESYPTPSPEDYFRLKKCLISLQDINGFYAGDSKRINDVTKSADLKTEQEVLVKFERGN